MKKIIDNFSGNSKSYKKYRPVYPELVYERVLDHVGQRKTCWDCGTGNGQVAVALARYFQKVYATDVSSDQIAHAEKPPNIEYSVQRAGQTNFPDQFFDLVTVGQAIHWFDHEAFALEVERVLKPSGILAFWSYMLLRVSPEIDRIIDYIYEDVTGPYWNEERKHVEAKYETIQLGFETVEAFDFDMGYHWSLDTLIGFINTWSGLKHYRKATGHDPLPEVTVRLRKVWKDDDIKPVVFPGFIRIERVRRK